MPGDDGLPDRLLVAVVPTDDVEVVDNWHVAGLQGSGSFDFRMSDVFVPEEMTFERAAGACRGGALFRQEAHVFLSNEVPPLCVGIARRALDQIADLADRTARFPGGPALSERPVFRKELGRAETRVRAARLVHRDAVETALAAAYAGDDLGGAHADVAAASVYTVETCAEVIADLFRYGGGRVLSLASPLLRYLRDALAACQHIGVSEENYERLGRLRVAHADRCPLPADRPCPLTDPARFLLLSANDASFHQFRPLSGLLKRFRRAKSDGKMAAGA
ncbi:MAG TPA: acyl-CoA dehydrogenase family protein [Trebonia sp.]|nr:acyl-CoA dehydrogenase family protein [Trebonia sp.]